VKSVLIDSGPLVAFLDRRDHWHRWAARHFKNAAAPFLTCDAVLTESCFLLAEVPGSTRRLLELIERDVIRPVFAAGQEAVAILTLMDRYASVPMSFADACLVRMSELLLNATVFTTDSDFRIYRRNKRQAIPMLCPFS